MPLTGLPGPLDPIAIALARADFREIDVPDLIRVLEERDARRLRPPVLIEQAQLHAGGVLGEEGEVHAVRTSNSDAEAVQRLLWVKLFSPGAGAKRFQEALVV